MDFPGPSTSLDVDSYLAFLEQEYLTAYVARGGAAVKLVVPQDTTAAEDFSAGLDHVGDGFAHAAVNAVNTRIHMIDQIFAAVARQMDWTALAQGVVTRAFHEAGFAPAPGGQLAVAAVALHHEVDQAELYRSVRRALERLVLKDTGLSHEFRVAMLRLCQSRLDRGDVDEAECETVLSWLCCERVPVGQLRKVSLQAKIGRHNARAMLLSLTRWLRVAGLHGLVLHLDLERLAVVRRPPAGLRDGHYYSKAAVLDAYEVLRQLIDGTDEFEGLLATVSLPQVLVNDAARGLAAYTALRLRVVDEVHDRTRPNPYSTLVRIGRRNEAAA
ncbi:MAG: hypothetical protein QG608_2897 [Actinomycetota bacterium]|nr:hypothetical protein [Actinomycetota bacterium]